MADQVARSNQAKARQQEAERRAQEAERFVWEAERYVHEARRQLHQSQNPLPAPENVQQPSSPEPREQAVAIDPLGQQVRSKRIWIARY